MLSSFDQAWAEHKAPQIGAPKTGDDAGKLSWDALEREEMRPGTMLPGKATPQQKLREGLLLAQCCRAKASPWPSAKTREERTSTKRNTE